jgi:hypothetical protein
MKLLLSVIALPRGQSEVRAITAARSGREELKQTAARNMNAPSAKLHASKGQGTLSICMHHLQL